MSTNYDNWERLVATVLQREKLRQLALCDSLSSSCNTSPSSSFNHGSSSRIDETLLHDELHSHNIISSIERFEEDNQSGKKSFIVGARKLMISHGQNPMYWNWTSHADSRFSEVAQLKCVCWLDIKCKIDTQLLSGNTIYGAYLVHKLANVNCGLGSVEGVVRFVNYEADLDAERRAGLLHLGRFVRRDDEWMEIELGEFYNDKGEDGEVEARLMDIRRGHWKSGLIIEGIEFRPKKKSFDHIEQTQELGIGNGSRDESETSYSTSEPQNISTTDEKNGKISYPTGVEQLLIPRGERPVFRIFSYRTDSRFSEVSRLIGGRLPDISCKLRTQRPLQQTIYGADMVFKLRTQMPLQQTIYGADMVFKLVKLVNVIYSLESAGFVFRLEDLAAILDAKHGCSLVHLKMDNRDRSLIQRKSSRLMRLVKRWYGCLKSGVIVERIWTSYDHVQQTGKKSYIIGARRLIISWGESATYWKWTSHANSRFSEVAELKSVCWLDIRCKIETQMLSRKTAYGAYLVFKLAGVNYGLGSVHGAIRFVECEADVDAVKKSSLLHLDPSHSADNSVVLQQTGRLATRRGDGWMEIELGDFFNDIGHDGEVEARLVDIWPGQWKSGIIIEGIEFRPK